MIRMTSEEFIKLHAAGRDGDNNITEGGFIINGKIKPKQRPRFYKGEIFTPRATQWAERAVAWAYKQKYKQPVTKHAVEINIDLYYRKPKSNKHVYTINKHDVDNVAKTVLDGLNKVLYHDDNQVVSLKISKCWGEADQAVVRFKILEGA